MVRSGNEKNSKLTYNKKIYNKMTACEICNTNIKNFKIHEQSNKHIRNTNQLLPFSLPKLKKKLCSLCNKSILNLKIHEKSNKHIRNTNQLLPFSLPKLKKKLCSLCNKSILNLKIHEKSKKHQINLMSCHYKHCRKGLQGNFKAYCYINIKMIDPRAFINNMISTIENKIQEQNWKNLKLSLSLHVEFYKDLPDGRSSYIQHWFNSGTMSSITDMTQGKDIVLEMINIIEEKYANLREKDQDG